MSDSEEDWEAFLDSDDEQAPPAKAKEPEAESEEPEAEPEEDFEDDWEAESDDEKAPSKGAAKHGGGDFDEKMTDELEEKYGLEDGAERKQVYKLPSMEDSGAVMFNERPVYDDKEDDGDVLNMESCDGTDNFLERICDRYSPPATASDLTSPKKGLDEKRRLVQKHKAVRAWLESDPPVDEVSSAIGVIYKSLNSIYENVGDDVSRCFVVDIDSVLIDLFECSELDFSRFGPQVLPMVFILENRLHQYCEGGRTIRIVAFEAIKSVYNDSVRLLIRELILRHLANSTRFHVHKFESWWQPEFETFLHNYMPGFVLVARPDSRFITPGKEYLFKAMVLHLMARDQLCVDSTTIVYTSNAMFGHTYSFQPTHREALRRPGRHARAMSQFLKTVFRPQDATLPVRYTPSEVDIPALDADLLAQLRSNKATAGSPRVLLNVYSIIKFLQEGTRSAWQEGTVVEVFSEGLGKWVLGTVVEVDDEILSVEYLSEEDGGEVAVRDYARDDADHLRAADLAAFEAAGDAGAAEPEEVTPQPVKPKRPADVAEWEPEHIIEWIALAVDDSDAVERFSKGVTDNNTRGVDLQGLCKGGHKQLKNNYRMRDKKHRISIIAAVKKLVADGDNSQEGDEEGDAGGVATADATPEKPAEPAAVQGPSADQKGETNELEQCIRQERVNFARATLLHTLLLEKLPLRARAQRLADPDRPWGELFEEFGRHAIAGLASEGASSDDVDEKYQGDQEAHARDYADFCDARLIESIRQNQSLLQDASSVGLDDEALSRLRALWEEVIAPLAELQGVKLFPIVEGCEDTPVEPPRANPEHALRMSSHELIQSVVPEIERSFGEKGLINRGGKITSQLDSRMFDVLEWQDGYIVPDNIKPAKPMAKMNKWEKKTELKFMNFMTKYSQSLKGGRIVLRDVIVAPPKREEEGGKKKQTHKGQKKGKNKKNKGKIDYRKKAQEEVLAKERRLKLEKVTNLTNLLLDNYRNVEMRITKLDDKLSGDNDPVTALPGNFILLDWCIQAAMGVDPNRNIKPAVRLWSITHDIFTRFVRDLEKQQLTTLQYALHLMSFPVPATIMVIEYVKIISELEKLDKRIEEKGLNAQDQQKEYEKIIGNVGYLWEQVHPKISDIEVYAKALRVHPDKWTSADIGVWLRGVGLSKYAENFARVEGKILLKLTEKQLKGKYKIKDTKDQKALAAHIQLLSGVKDYMRPFANEDVQIAIGMTYERFQLSHCGPSMKRNVKSAPDHRVTGFYPDQWQRDLLDLVDDGRSALVVAPTSSGKTFISFYTMKQTMVANRQRSSAKDKRRIIYVCPTKALVQQVAADIYALYGGVFGFLTEDYNRTVLECEVLVTVPDTFYQLLLSTERHEFVASIDRVIFDEVHCLGKSEGGEVWERCIMLCPCPWLALSATVGHPEIFHEWLQRVQKNFNIECEIVMGGMKRYNNNIPTEERYQIERWSNLQKYMYLPEAQYLRTQSITAQHTEELRKVTGVVATEMDEKTTDEEDFTHNGAENYSGSTRELSPYPAPRSPSKAMSWRKNLFVGGLPKSFRTAAVPVHPAGVISLGLGLDQHRDFAENKTIKLSPADSFRLYETMFSHVSKMSAEFRASLAKLRPEVYFPKLVITKSECLAYESGLKRELKEWADTDSGVVSNILSSMMSSVEKRIANLTQTCRASQINPFSPAFVRHNITQLLLDQHVADRLPMLCFCLDRTQCEQLTFQILGDLECLERGMKNDESDVRKTEEKNQEKKQKALETMIKKLEKAKNRNRSQRTEDGAGGDDPQDIDRQIQELKAELGMGSVQDTVDPRFTFCRKSERMDAEEVRYWKQRVLHKTKWPEDHPLLRCLDRGIGLHHDGLNRTYKHLVETLFRAHHLKVVITTDTLSMGVNMPARTVAFAGDSPYLTPLNYRQMMGRAGRRGYDNIGHVVFMGIQPRKIAYLMTAELKSLHGHFPMDTSLALKTCQMYNAYRQEGSKDVAANRASALLTVPFFGSDHKPKPKLEQQILNNFRFSVEYLQQMGLVDERGENVGMGGIVAKTSGHQPDNLAFATLLRSSHAYDCTVELRAKPNAYPTIDSNLRVVRVPSNADQTLWQKKNLKVGDVLKSIDGMAITSSNWKSTLESKLRGEYINCKMQFVTKRNIFEKICEDYDASSPASKKKVAKKLLRIICQVFCRRPIPCAVAKRQDASTSRSTVLSDEGVEDVLKVLRWHNKNSLDVLVEYTRTMIRSGMLDDAAGRRLAISLPESEISFAAEFSAPKGTFAGKLEESAIQAEVRSPLAALAGLDDSFGSAGELMETVRSDVQVHHDSIPMCETRNSRRQLCPLNSFAVDFFNHGEYELTLTQNAMRDGQAWHELKTMQLLLKSIRKCFRKISDLSGVMKDKQAMLNAEADAIKAQYSGLKKVRRAMKGAVSGLQDMYEYYDDKDRKWIRKTGTELGIHAKTIEESLEYADQVVQAFSFLQDEFADIFNTVNPIGPVSNWQQGTEQLLEQLG